MVIYLIRVICVLYTHYDTHSYIPIRCIYLIRRCIKIEKVPCAEGGRNYPLSIIHCQFIFLPLSCCFKTKNKKDMNDTVFPFALLCFTSFFTLINPLGTMPVFLSMTTGMSAKEREKIARKRRLSPSLS